MANLYEIDRNLTSLVDEETGEILDFELHAFAKKKGYKSGWAYHIAKERGFVH